MRQAPALATLAVAQLLAVEATASCSVDLEPVAFGTIDITRNEAGTGKVKVTCDQPGSYFVGIGTGSGGQGGRRMEGPNGSRLDYDLYLDPGHQVVWGDGVSTGQAASGSNDGSKADTYTIHGLVPAQPGKPAGSYVDSLVVTVEF
jgi:spore coat protein U-like protein